MKLMKNSKKSKNGVKINYLQIQNNKTNFQEKLKTLLFNNLRY